MLLLIAATILSLFSEFTLAHGAHGHGSVSRRSTSQIPLGESTLTINNIPFSTRAYWMRQANLALPSACPFAAFGTVIVNHTDTSGLGQLVCTGANSGSTTGNPTLHGKFMTRQQLQPQYYTAWQGCNFDVKTCEMRIGPCSSRC